MELFLTVLSGVVVFVLGQFILEFLIKPIKEYFSLKQKILYSLTLYCNYYCNPYNIERNSTNVRRIEEYNNAGNEMRKIGAEVAAFLGTIPKCFKKTRNKLDAVMHNLIGISNGFYRTNSESKLGRENHDLDKEIRNLLSI